MPLPSNPSNNQTAVVNGILYTYNSTKGAWTVSTNSEVSYTMSAVTATGLVTAGNIKTTSGIFWSNGAPLGGSAGGTTNQIQYNSSNSFAGATNFTYTAASGNVVIGATTATSSTTTGALVVAGGVGVAGDTYAGGNLTVGAYSSNTRANLFVYTGILGTTSGASIVMAELNNNNGNQSYLRFITNRVAAGSNWTTSSTKIQQRIDVTDQGYIEFNPLGSNYGVDIGNGSSPTIRAFENGNVVLPTTTASTSTTTGAFVVKGGAGIAGQLTIGGIADVTGAAYLRNTTYLGSQLVQNIAADATTLYLRGGALAFQDAAASATKLYIDTSSNVGIGTSSPTANLHIKKGTNGIYFEPTGNWAAKIFNATDAANEHGLVVGQRWAAAASTAFEVGSTYGSGSAWRSYFKIDGLGGLTMSSGGSERVVMNSTTGNVVITATTTSTSTTTGALVVAGGAGIAGQVTAGNVMTTSGVFWANGAAFTSGGVAAGTTGSFQYNSSNSFAAANVTFAPANGNVVINSTTTTTSTTTGALVVKGGIGAAGNVYIGGSGYFVGNVYSSYSDTRLKTILGQISNSSDIVNSIETFYYEPNELAISLGVDAGHRQVGVSAQSVQKVMPEAVGPSPLNQEYLTVQYERLVPLLIEAVKELKKEIEDLKSYIRNK